MTLSKKKFFLKKWVEYIIIFSQTNNILSNKFDNDNIDNNSNEGNTNHHVVIGRKALKRKCNDAVQPIEKKSRTENTLICENSTKEKKAKINNDIMIEKDKLNDEKRLVYLPRRLQWMKTIIIIKTPNIMMMMWHL